MRGLIMFVLICPSLLLAQPAEEPSPPSEPERIGRQEPKKIDEPTSVDVQKLEEDEIKQPSTSDEAYQRKITVLENRVNELKEKIFRSKARLANLKGAVLSSSIAGSEAQIVHRNEMGSSFKLERAIYSLDGTPIRSLVDEDGKLSDQEEIEILNGPIVPGNHTISVVMTYRGNGYGIFSYLRGYVFNLRSSHTFHADEGKIIKVKVVGYEKGGITTDLKDRPDIRFEDQLSDSRRITKTKD
ncbi:dihydrolipoamide acetyltransferase [Myxococcota bacterium]|nr:dihydrolipoamide acetyltransferase [Myxococcota bacterium]